MKKSEFRIFRKLFPLIFLCITLLAFLFQTRQAISVVSFHADFFEKQDRYKNELIILDAGHGGEDGGAVGINGVHEKNINFAITLFLKEELENAGFPVLLTRDSDTLIGDNSLPTIAKRKRSDTMKRLEIVKQYENCVLVSIHQNEFSQSKYKGAQMFYSKNREESSILAEAIRNAIVENLQPNNKRESKPAEKNIYILYNSQVPSVLVECGFISNYEEAELLTQTEYQKEMAIAIRKGLVSYYEKRIPQENTSANIKSSFLE